MTVSAFELDNQTGIFLTLKLLISSIGLNKNLTFITQYLFSLLKV